jgi:hypothetical protein
MRPEDGLAKAFQASSASNGQRIGQRAAVRVRQAGLLEVVAPRVSAARMESNGASLALPLIAQSGDCKAPDTFCMLRLPTSS